MENLISLAQRQFDVFITVDKKSVHQQNLQDIGFGYYCSRRESQQI